MRLVATRTWRRASFGPDDESRYTRGDHIITRHVQLLPFSWGVVHQRVRHVSARRLFSAAIVPSWRGTLTVSEVCSEWDGKWRQWWRVSCPDWDVHSAVKPASNSPDSVTFGKYSSKPSKINKAAIWQKINSSLTSDLVPCQQWFNHRPTDCCFYWEIGCNKATLCIKFLRSTFSQLFAVWKHERKKTIRGMMYVFVWSPQRLSTNVRCSVSCFSLLFQKWQPAWLTCNQNNSSSGNQTQGGSGGDIQLVPMSCLSDTKHSPFI